VGAQIPVPSVHGAPTPTRLPSGDQRGLLEEPRDEPMDVAPVGVHRVGDEVVSVPLDQARMRFDRSGREPSLRPVR
jgi:hypothetical protein